MGILGENLRALMKARGATQKQLGKAVGITQASISRYLSGRTPKAEELFKLAEFFGVRADDLLKRLSPLALVFKGTAPDRLDAQLFGELATETRISVTSAAIQRGSVDVQLFYMSGSPPSGLPATTRLTSPEWRHRRALGNLFQREQKPEAILLACLPEDLSKEDFLNQLTPHCVSAMEFAAFLITFGADGGRLLFSKTTSAGLVDQRWLAEGVEDTSARSIEKTSRRNRS
jgi:transcriptional regulator with XRE-family HTH domain